MATFKNPAQYFAPIEVIERMLEIREECGFTTAIFLHNSGDLADYLDAYGFDMYAFSSKSGAIDYDKQQAPLVPNGDVLHSSPLAH